ncbi:hypothetical protein M422DRAFT_240919 [Sphaerobolus stellatus SS14]|nr:hypothetical protein M422DRAFT_240919 [Sphaerobolus stellatus SS14]
MRNPFDALAHHVCGGSTALLTSIPIALHLHRVSGITLAGTAKDAPRFGGPCCWACNSRDMRDSSGAVFFVPQPSWYSLGPEISRYLMLIFQRRDTLLVMRGSRGAYSRHDSERFCDHLLEDFLEKLCRRGL